MRGIHRLNRPGFYLLAVALLLLALMLVFRSGREQDGLAVIGEWASPYPHVSEVIYAPRPEADMVWAWLVETPDPPEAVFAFYLDDAHRPGWEVTLAGPMLSLHREGYRLTILVNPSAGDSRIYYVLKTVPVQP